MALMKPKLPSHGLAAFATYMGLAVLVGLLASVARAVFGDWPGAPGLILNVLINVISLGVALLICVWWWRGIDEAAREAHKWAWWWGGCTGMSVGGVLLLTLLERDALSLVEMAAAGLDGGDMLGGGMVLMLLCQVIGYGVAWAVWWAKRR